MRATDATFVGCAVIGYTWQTLPVVGVWTAVDRQKSRIEFQANMVIRKTIFATTKINKINQNDQLGRLPVRTQIYTNLTIVLGVHTHDKTLIDL